MAFAKAKDLLVSESTGQISAVDAMFFSAKRWVWEVDGKWSKARRMGGRELKLGWISSMARASLARNAGSSAPVHDTVEKSCGIWTSGSIAPSSMARCHNQLGNAESCRPRCHGLGLARICPNDGGQSLLQGQRMSVSATARHLGATSNRSGGCLSLCHGRPVRAEDWSLCVATDNVCRRARERASLRHRRARAQTMTFCSCSKGRSPRPWPVRRALPARGAKAEALTEVVRT